MNARHAHLWLSLKRIAAICAIGALGACGGNSDMEEAPVVPAPADTSVQVVVAVVDAAAAPLADVQVSMVGGSATATTLDDGSGTFTLPAPASGLVKFSKAGYADTFKRFSFAANSSTALIRTGMRPRDAAQPLDASLGGGLVGRDGATVVLPANGLVDAVTGAVISGMVDIAMTSVDVSGDGLRAFPGRFMSTDTAGALRMIASYGTTEFILTQGGKRLNLAPGQTATIELPIYTPFHSPGVPVALGDTIPLLSLDETTGDWKQEGTGTVVASNGSPTGMALRGTVGHFSWWNCDDFVDTARLDLDIQLPDVADADKVPDTRPPGTTEDIETDPNKYSLGLSRPVHIDAKTADDRLLRQQGINFEAAFSDDPFEKRRLAMKGARYAGTRGAVIPANRGVALTVCAQIKRADGVRFAPAMACGTVHVSAAKDATVKATVPLVLDFISNYPDVTRQPAATTVDLGAAASFSVVAARVSGGEVAYQWTRNGAPIAGATASTHVTAPTVQADANSLYAVILTAPAGATVSLPARLSLTPPPPPPPPPPNAGTDRWVDAALGNDANAGTAAAPLRTISAAIAVVQSGGTVWLADGTWTPAIDSSLDQFNHGLNCNNTSPRVTGTSLRAVNAGRVTIKYESGSAFCVGDSQIRGVRFENTSITSSGVVISAAVPGSSLLSGVSFERGLIAVRNGAKLTIEAGGLASYGNLGDGDGRAISVMDAGSEVIVNGGAFDALSAIKPGGAQGCGVGGSLFAFSGGHLVLNQVDLRPGASRSAGTIQHVAVAGCSNARIELNGTTIAGFVQGQGSGAAEGYAVSVTGSSLVLGSGSLLSSNGTGVYMRNSDVSLAAGVQISDSLRDGIYVAEPSLSSRPAALTMGAGSVIRGSGRNGIDARGSNVTPPSIDVSGATLVNNGGAGLRLREQGQCRMRGTTVTGNVDSGLQLDQAGANCDLGTAASPGGNTFTNAGPNVFLLASSTRPLTLFAVGNTWAANQQGSNAQGRYAVPAGQTVLEVAGPVTTGTNYWLTNFAKVRLAE